MLKKINENKFNLMGLFVFMVLVSWGAKYFLEKSQNSFSIFINELNLASSVMVCDSLDSMEKNDCSEYPSLKKEEFVLNNFRSILGTGKGDYSSKILRLSLSGNEKCYVMLSPKASDHVYIYENKKSSCSSIRMSANKFSLSGGTLVSIMKN